MLSRLQFQFNLQVVAVHIPFGHLLFYVPHTLIWQIKSALNSILYLVRTPGPKLYTLRIIQILPFL